MSKQIPTTGLPVKRSSRPEGFRGTGQKRESLTTSDRKEIYERMVYSIADYLEANGFHPVVIGNARVRGPVDRGAAFEFSVRVTGTVDASAVQSPVSERVSTEDAQGVQS